MITSVRPATASTAKTVFALFAVLSLLLTAFAIARPVTAFHDPANGPEVEPTTEAFPGGDPICPAGSVGIRFENPVAGDSEEVLLADGSTATVTIISTADNELTFEVEDGLAAVVKVKGGIATQDDVNIYDYSGFPGGGVPHDDGLTTPTESGISHVDFCLVPVEASILIYKTDQTGADVEGATFVVKDGEDIVGGPAMTDSDGLVCFDDLVFEKEYTVEETAAPAGWDPAVPATQTVEASLGTCEDREGGPDATFTNTLLGSLLVLKTDDGDPAQALEGAEFTITGPDEFETTATSDADGWFCLDGLIFGEEYTVTETLAPEGYVIAGENPQSHTIDDTATCEERIAGDPAADLMFVNEEEEEPTGSITIVKVVDCEECETLTIGYWFNAAGVHDDHTNALLGAGIEADGETFTSADQVRAYIAADISGASDGQPGLSARGQLTIQYLAAVLNVLNNGEDCELAERVFNDPDSPFDGWTVGEILAEAERAFEDDSDFSDEQIKDALDAINNSTQLEENPLTCDGAENGTLDGVEFTIFLASEYPDGTPEGTGTTGDDGAGTVVFGGLTIGEDYVIVETGFPEGVTCEIVGVSEPATLVDGAIHVTLSEEDLDESLNLTLTVENDCEEQQEEEFGSLLIAKTDDNEEEPMLLGGAVFEVDGVEFADTDEDGFVCVDGLTLSAMVAVEETAAPDGYIGQEGIVDVPVTSTDDCETRLAAEDPLTDADVTFVNVAEEEEESGRLEIIKFFCPTEGEDAIFWAVLTDEPLPSIQGEEAEMPSDEGCTLGAESEEALGVWFEIEGGDLTEPLLVQTEWESIIELDLTPGTYTVTEVNTGLSAVIEIVVDGDTVVTVFNFEEAEEEEGRLKLLKFSCENEGDTTFAIVEGDGDLSDLSTLPGNCASPAPMDATFTLTTGGMTSVEFTLGDDGARLIPLDVGTYTLNEVDPNEATSPAFEISDDATTTVIVFNFEGEGVAPEEEGEEEEEQRDDTLGGQLPNTSTAPVTGSVPAALLALVMLTGLGAAGYAMQAEARRRR